MRDIQYQVETKARVETNPKSVISQNYHDYYDIFSKKNSNTLLPHWKYDHKIHSEKKQKPGHASLYKMSSKEHDAIKRYLISHLAKGFIQATWHFTLCQYFLLKNLEEKFDFVLITKDWMLL